MKNEDYPFNGFKVEFVFDEEDYVINNNWSINEILSYNIDFSRNYHKSDHSMNPKMTEEVTPFLPNFIFPFLHA